MPSPSTSPLCGTERIPYPEKGASPRPIWQCTPAGIIELYQWFRMAGAGGFEPPYGGIKIRCLTTWLRPIGKPADARVSRYSNAAAPLRASAGFSAGGLGQAAESSSRNDLISERNSAEAIGLVMNPSAPAARIRASSYGMEAVIATTGI